MHARLASAFLLLLVAAPLTGCYALMEQLSAGATATEATDQGRAAVIVTNRMRTRLVALYASSCSDDSWGYNQIDYPIGRGGVHTLDLEPGCYDLKARDESGREVEELGVEVGAGQAFDFTISG